jgi:hypothetical protein
MRRVLPARDGRGRARARTEVDATKIGITAADGVVTPVPLQAAKDP